MRLPIRLIPSVASLLLGVIACDASRTTAPVQSDASALVSSSSALKWTVLDLGAPPATLQFGFFPQAISNAGTVAGQGRIDGFTHAITVTPSGTYTVMRPLPGDFGTFPYQINALGVTAGVSVLDRDYSSRVAVTWDRDGHPTPIPGLPRSDAEDALLINDLGFVAGYTKKFSDYGSGFVWHRSWPEVRALEMPHPGFYPNMTDMNIRGQIVGSVQDLTYAVVAVMWDVTGKATLLPSPDGATSSEANAINDFGLIAGTAGLENGTNVGWIWSASRGYRLYSPPAGYTNLIIGNIDNFGRAYGVAYNADGTQALVTIRDGRMNVIPSINGGKASLIVSATGIISGTVPVGGVVHPTIWIPRR